jgi:hypothetical protein
MEEMAPGVLKWGGPTPGCSLSHVGALADKGAFGPELDDDGGGALFLSACREWNSSTALRWNESRGASVLAVSLSFAERLRVLLGGVCPLV